MTPGSSTSPQGSGLVTTSEVEAVASPDVRLRLARFRADGSRGPLLITPAMMAHAGYLGRFAEAAARAGWDCFTLDFRGHGRSRPPTPRRPGWGFDVYVDEDLPAAVGAMLEAAGTTSYCYVGHSLGGLVGVAAFATAKVPPPRRLVLVTASPWTNAGLRKRAVAALLVLLSRPLGFLPARPFGLGADEPHAYLRDLRRWVETRSWRSATDVDYLAAAASLKLPALVVRGREDWMVGEAESRILADLLAAQTILADGDHFGFFLGDGSWGKVLDWLAAA
jgi:predicted alpha/beta hydrolase